MTKPEMIIFDYGHTLVYEAAFDGVKGAEAVLLHATRNKNNLTARQVSDFADNLFFSLKVPARDNHIEVHNHMFNNFVYEYLQIDIALDPDRMEQVFWDAAAPGQAMPHIEEMLTYLHENNIRTGVISNISYSGATLKKRINSLIPSNRFEFVIASSEYVYRKPNKMLFELALKKAGLPSDKVWYCGDSPEFDVAGAASAGIFPVWYHYEKDCFYRDNSYRKLDQDHLYIRSWRELINALL